MSIDLALHIRAIKTLEPQLAELEAKLAAAVVAEDASRDLDSGSPETARAVREAEGLVADLQNEINRTRVTLERRRGQHAIAAREALGINISIAQRQVQIELVRDAKKLRAIAVRAGKFAKEAIAIHLESAEVLSTMHARCLHTGLTPQQAEVVRTKILNLDLVWLGAWGCVQRAVIDRRLLGGASPAIWFMAVLPTRMRMRFAPGLRPTVMSIRYGGAQMMPSTFPPLTSTCAASRIGPSSHARNPLRRGYSWICVPSPKSSQTRLP